MFGHIDRTVVVHESIPRRQVNFPGSEPSLPLNPMVIGGGARIGQPEALRPVPNPYPEMEANRVTRDYTGHLKYEMADVVARKIARVKQTLRNAENTEGDFEGPKGTLSVNGHTRVEGGRHTQEHESELDAYMAIMENTDE